MSEYPDRRPLAGWGLRRRPHHHQLLSMLAGVESPRAAYLGAVVCPAGRVLGDIAGICGLVAIPAKHGLEFVVRAGTPLRGLGLPGHGIPAATAISGGGAP